MLDKPRNLVIRVEGDVLDRAKRAAMEQGTTVSKVVRSALNRLAAAGKPRPRRTSKKGRS